MNLRASVAVVSLLVCVSAKAAEPPSPETRIALRYGFADVLLVGGACTASPKGLSPMVYHVPLMPARRLLVETPEFLQGKGRSEAHPKTDWNIGDKWQIYPGGGAPVSAVIEKLVLLEYGHKYYEGAIAHMESTDDANRIAALRATAYLGAPGEGLPDVSQAPLLPEFKTGEERDEYSRIVTPLLLRQARKIVRDENWKTQGIEPGIYREKIVEMNAGLLADTDDSRSPNQLRIFRWPLPGRQPLLFVEAMWSRDEKPPLFAVNAVMERNSSKFLSFDTEPAESVRTVEALTPNCSYGGFKCPPNNYPTTLEETSRFLNAWKIGDKYFVLTFSREQVGFSVMLHELGFQNGLVQTGLSFRMEY
jgi:hypothetical protein